MRCYWPGCSVLVDIARGGRILEGSDPPVAACCKHAPLLVVVRTVGSEAAIYGARRLVERAPGLAGVLREAAERYRHFYEAVSSRSQARPKTRRVAVQPDVIDVEFAEVKDA